MASPIAHIIFAEKIFDRIRNENLLWPEFVVGTSFPDIRYPAKIERKITHTYPTSEKDIPQNNSFKAGMYAHSIVDEKFANALSSFDLYQYGREDVVYEAALKYATDRILFKNFNKKQETAKYFDKYYEEEKEYVKNDSVIRNWHFNLKNYILNGPTDEMAKLIISQNGFDNKVIDKGLTYMKKINEDEKIVEKINKIGDLI